MLTGKKLPLYISIVVGALFLAHSLALGEEEFDRYQPSYIAFDVFQSEPTTLDCFYRTEREGPLKTGKLVFEQGLIYPYRSKTIYQDGNQDQFPRPHFGRDDRKISTESLTISELETFPAQQASVKLTDQNGVTESLIHPLGERIEAEFDTVYPKIRFDAGQSIANRLNVKVRRLSSMMAKNAGGEIVVPIDQYSLVEWYHHTNRHALERGTVKTNDEGGYEGLWFEYHREKTGWEIFDYVVVHNAAPVVNNSPLVIKVVLAAGVCEHVHEITRDKAIDGFFKWSLKKI